MYAAHTVEPSHFGIPERHKVVLFERRSERDRFVKYVRENAEGWAEFRRKHPTGLVPTFYRWYVDTTCEPISMREARELIGDDDVCFLADGHCDAYAYTKCDIYEFSLLPYGERIGWKNGRHYRTLENGEEVAA